MGGSSAEAKTGSAFSRVQEHVEELRRFFDLPADELFLDEFYCALHKRILLQGRMYIFEHYLCFYANVFGWVKQKVIPLNEVREVTKKRNYGFPNSIEVVWKKKEFFTSFLNRSDAFTLLCDAVTQVRESSLSEKGSVESNSQLSLASKVKRSKENAAKQQQQQESVSSNGNGDEDSDLDEDDDDIDVWSVTDGSAPAIPENMALLCEDRYDVTVQEFFGRTLSLDSMFLDEYHKKRGDTRYRISDWERLHEISGSVRQATFVSPVKGVRGIGFMSPKNTECNQDHRLRIYSGDHLVFEISQVMKDIPYGDNFSVEIRWDVRPNDRGGCGIAIHVAVPFIRSVMAPFRNIIESNVMKEMQDSVKLMTEMLKDAVSCGSESPSKENRRPSESSVGHSPKSPSSPSTHVLNKLERLLQNEEGVRRLERLLKNPPLPVIEGPAEKRQSLPSAADVGPSTTTTTGPMHQNTTTMTIQSSGLSSVVWILFFCCLFVLFCQVVLVIFLVLSWRSPAEPHFHSSKASSVESIEQLQALEHALTTIVHLFNSTAKEIIIDA